MSNQVSESLSGLKTEIENIFKDKPDVVKNLIKKIEKAEALHTYINYQKDQENHYKKGFILQSNFSIKKFLDNIFIKEMFDTILEELDNLLQNADENLTEIAKQFKSEVETHKKIYQSDIENLELPKIDLKSSLKMLSWIPGSDRVFFYSMTDLRAIITKMLEELLKTYDKVSFNIQLPPPSTKEEQEAEKDQLKNYAEMIFKNCIEKGVDPSNVNLTINGQHVDPNVMFKNEMAQWPEQSAQNLKKELEKAKAIEAPHIEHARRSSKP